MSEKRGKWGGSGNLKRGASESHQPRGGRCRALEHNLASGIQTANPFFRRVRPWCGAHLRRVARPGQLEDRPAGRLGPRIGPSRFVAQAEHVEGTDCEDAAVGRPTVKGRGGEAAVRWRTCWGCGGQYGPTWRICPHPTHPHTPNSRDRVLDWRRAVELPSVCVPQPVLAVLPTRHDEIVDMVPFHTPARQVRWGRVCVEKVCICRWDSGRSAGYHSTHMRERIVCVYVCVCARS